MPSVNTVHPPSFSDSGMSEMNNGNRYSRGLNGHPCLTPFLVGSGLTSVHLLFHSSCCMLVDGLQCVSHLFTESKLSKLSPQAILTDSVKAL